MSRSTIPHDGPTISADVPRSRLEHVARTGPLHLRPIYAAMIDPGIGLALVAQRSGRFDIASPRPFVALIGDDTDCALGPAGFHRKSVRRLAGRVRSIAIIASDVEPKAYAAAAALAALGHNVLIVETRPEQEGAWIELLRAAAASVPILLCTPIGGTA